MGLGPTLSRRVRRCAYERLRRALDLLEICEPRGRAECLILKKLQRPASKFNSGKTCNAGQRISLKNAMRKLSLSNHAQEEVSRLEEKRYDRYKTKIHAYHLDIHVYDYEIGMLKQKALEPWSTPVYPSFSFQKLSQVSNFSVKLGKSSFYGLLMAKKRIFDKPKNLKKRLTKKVRSKKYGKLVRLERTFLTRI